MNPPQDSDDDRPAAERVEPPRRHHGRAPNEQLMATVTAIMGLCQNMTAQITEINQRLEILEKSLPRLLTNRPQGPLMFQPREN